MPTSSPKYTTRSAHQLWISSLPPGCPPCPYRTLTEIIPNIRGVLSCQASFAPEMAQLYASEKVRRMQCNHTIDVNLLCLRESPDVSKDFLLIHRRPQHVLHTTCQPFQRTPFTIVSTHQENQYVRTCDIQPCQLNIGDEQHSRPITVTGSELIYNFHALLLGHAPIHRHQFDSR